MLRGLCWLSGNSTDRKLLNLRRLKARSKVKEHHVRNMLFADDCALNDNWKCNAAWVNSHLPVMLLVSPSVQGKRKSCTSQHLTTTWEEYSELSITVNGETLKAMDKFTYLSSTPARNGRINDKVAHKISNVCAAFGKLSEKVWEGKGISVEATSVQDCCPALTALFLWDLDCIKPQC